MSSKVNPNMKILIIDDMATMRKIVKNMLKAVGFKNLHEADDGSTGLAMLENALQEQKPFEFVISDSNMPQMSGLDLVKHLRATEEFKNLPFLMITAETEQSHVVTAIKAGVNNFIVKPFSADTLKSKIAKIFK
jgi:two-component system chemotaxis response regulator CheY